jgi:acetolactate synthase I/III small subunit
MQKQEHDHTYQLTLSVRNRPGVLVRCAQIFNRRGHNIEALQVAPSKAQPGVSTMKITAYGQSEAMGQVVAQLTKLVDVLSVKEVEL